MHKPCPFCCYSDLRILDYANSVRVVCLTCASRGPEFAYGVEYTLEEAIDLAWARWNNRPLYEVNDANNPS